MATVTEYRCFVGGLAWSTDDGSLSEAFSAFGKVLESKVINDRETGRSRGFGFVTFADKQSMLDAIEAMDGKELEGRIITVSQAQSRSSGRGGAGGGYRGSGGGGYNGGSRHDGHGGYGNKSSNNSRERGSGGGGGYGGDGSGGYGDSDNRGGGGYGSSASGGGSDSGNWRK